MAYQSLYRKWRPQCFSDIVGQEHITKTLQSEIVSGRISHAYLFCGSRGTGKTTAAKVFAKAVNCENPQNGNPCNKCRCCTGITSGGITDIYEIDAASNNGVENIRAINTESSYLPSGVKYKIYIIDEVHMLSVSAFNALLKTLEEPPEHVIFILATTESHKIPNTILSRCQRFDFKYISDDAMRARLKFIADAEKFSVDETAFDLIINAAKGGMRDAVSILDQCSSYNGGVIDDKIVRMVSGVLGNGILIKMADAMLKHDIAGLLSLAKTVFAGGYDVSRLAECLISHFRNLIVAGCSDNPSSLIDANEEDVKLMVSQSSAFGTARAVSILDILMDAYETVKWSQNPKVVLETALIKIAHPKADVSYDALLERIEALEKREPVVIAPIDTEEEEEYVADIPELEDEEYIPETEGFEDDFSFIPEGAVVSDAPAETEDRGFDASWNDILTRIDQVGGTLLSMAARGSSYRREGSRLFISGIVSYLHTQENKLVVKKAVSDVTGEDVEIVFEEDIPVKTDLSGVENSDDPLAALANKMAGKINITS